MDEKKKRDAEARAAGRAAPPAGEGPAGGPAAHPQGRTDSPQGEKADPSEVVGEEQTRASGQMG
jgi:hypothetical protein